MMSCADCRSLVITSTVLAPAFTAGTSQTTTPHSRANCLQHMSFPPTTELEPIPIWLTYTSCSLPHSQPMGQRTVKPLPNQTSSAMLLQRAAAYSLTLSTTHHNNVKTNP